MDVPQYQILDISIHALLAESDLRVTSNTRSQPDFYPRSPCGERHLHPGYRALIHHFYPRSPCGERPPQPPQGKSSIKFLSTLSLRRATYWSCVLVVGRSISIHALLAESDLLNAVQIVIIVVFLSTLSLRRATPATSRNNKNNIFLSTLSLRRATARRAARQQPAGISIHALLAESDASQTNLPGKN